jgi:hypothetical protein
VMEVHRAGRNFICSPLGLNPGHFLGVSNFEASHPSVGWGRRKITS